MIQHRRRQTLFQQYLGGALCCRSNVKSSRKPGRHFRWDHNAPQAYVVSVYENTSQVVVFDGLDFRVGDYVRFK